jgi:hypothetical protein
MEIESNPRWLPNKNKNDIYHHGPRPISIICHLRDPPTFSLPTTFKGGRPARLDRSESGGIIVKPMVSTYIPRYRL